MTRFWKGAVLLLCLLTFLQGVWLEALYEQADDQQKTIRTINKTVETINKTMMVR